MKRYYLPRPNCHSRMKRTGAKEKEQKTLEGFWLYTRELECPNCGRVWTYSESRNSYGYELLHPQVNQA
jgi:hypothetical protein